MKHVPRLVALALSLVLCCCEKPAPTQPAPEPEPVDARPDEVTPSDVSFAPPPEENPASAPAAPEEVEPGVAPTNAQTRGRLSPRKINPVLKAAEPAFFGCYEVSLQNDASLHGNVTLILVISEQGRVPHAEVSAGASSLNHPKLSACLVAEAMKLQFERPTGGKVVTQYGLEFNPPAETEQNLE